MHVHWDLLLSELGCKVTKNKEHLQPCPLHPDGRNKTLSVVDGLTSTRFTCSNKNCNFYTGDAIRLTAAVKNVSKEQAKSLFDADGALYHTRRNISKCHQEAYNNTGSSQEHIKAYIHGCHTALKTVDGCILRSKWEELGWCSPNAELPETFGALLPDNLPPELHSLQTKTYKDNFAIHAYSYDDYITAVSLRYATSPDTQKLIQIFDQRIGVYPNPPENLEIAFIVSDERAATQLYTNVSAYDKKGLPVYAALALPLPPVFSSLSTLYLLAYPAAPLNIDTALRYLCTSDIVENSKKPNMRVLEYKRNPDVPQLQRLKHKNHSDNSITLTSWIAKQLKHLTLSEDINFVEQVLLNGPNLGKVKDDLIGALRKEHAPTELLDVLEAHCEKPKSSIILANGYSVHRTPHGYRGAKGANTPATIRLSNFTWDITEELLDTNNNLWYRCKFNLPDHMGVVNVQLKQKDFESKNALMRAITGELGKQGITNKAIAYQVSGFDWAEIRDGFKKDIEVYQETACYGVDKNLDLHLPGMIISTNGRAIGPQNRVLHIPENISLMYAGIDHRTKSATRLAPIAELWGGQTTEEAALALGISHVIYCIVQDFLCKRDSVKTPTQHLCYADPMESTWTPVCKQLASIFSGSPKINNLPGFRGQGVKYKTYFDELKQLGSLPWIAELPDTNNIVDILKNIPVNVIGMANDTQAAALSGTVDIAFVALDSVPTFKMSMLPASRLRAIRSAIPELIQLAIITAKDLKLDQWHAEQPAHDTYYGIANIFDKIAGLKERAPVNMLTRKTYIPYTTSILPKFFECLRKYVHFSKGSQTVRQYRGAPDKKKRGHAVYIMDDIVMIDKALVHTFNTLSQNRKVLQDMSVPMLTKELLEQKYLIDVAPGKFEVDLDRFWVIDRRTWEEKVTGALFTDSVIQLPETSQDKILRLVNGD